MKKLLIHSNNTSFNRPEIFSISEQFVFDVDFDKDVDFYIDEILGSGELKRKINEVDIVFIKVSLSNNYLEYLGLRLTYHIRLTKSLGIKSNLPIVLIAEESIQFLGLTYPEPNLLFTGGIYLIKESIEDYRKVAKWYADNRIKPLENMSFFINSILINPPANYQSHHSIANEWSILRWSKVLGISQENILLKNIQKNIVSLLYYKFLQTKYPIEQEPDIASFNIQGQGKVLYIDDEWDKGWDLVLNEFLLSSTDIVFETLKYNFKDKSQDDILLECKSNILKQNPEIVLLDLRLSESDISNSANSKELTGYKLLQEIKAINPGIQVVIFTASNKVWNFTELQKAGADDFVFKESPELSSDPAYSRNCIEKLASSLSDALKMSFLKKVHSKMDVIELLHNIGNNDEENEFYNRLKVNLGIAFRVLVDTKYSDKYFNYAYLQLFQIIEDFCNLSYVFKDGNDCFVYVNDKEICVNKTLSDKWESAISFTDKYRLIPKTLPIKEKRKRLDTNYLVSAILIFRLGYENSSALNWTDIYTLRNTKAAHFNIDHALNKEDIYIILNFIKNFINPKNQKETNVAKGFKVKTLEESIELLKIKFQQ